MADVTTIDEAAAPYLAQFAEAESSLPGAQATWLGARRRHAIVKTIGQHHAVGARTGIVFAGGHIATGATEVNLQTTGRFLLPPRAGNAWEVG